MQLNPSEISELIKSRIQKLDAGAQMRTQGTVVSVTDGICRIHGLSDVMQGEMLEFPNNTFGLALNLERDSVGSVILGEYTHITEGDIVKTTGKILSVPIGPELLGRVVNSLGQPIDGKGPINAKLTDVIEKVAPGVIARQSVSQPVQTGLKAIDAMVPVGRGQRELIIGDRQTGKTAVAVDTIINQKGKDLFCVYVAIGQKASTIANVVRKLEEHGAMGYTIVVAASPSQSPPLQYIPPHSASTLAQSLPPRPPAAAARTGGRTGRRFLSALAPSRARGARQPRLRGEIHQGAGEGQDRLAHGAAGDRDPGGRRHGVRADQRDLHYRWADLPRDRPFQRRHPAGDQRRHFRVAGRRRGADQDHETPRHRWRRAPRARAIP